MSPLPALARIFYRQLRPFTFLTVITITFLTAYEERTYHLGLGGKYEDPWSDLVHELLASECLGSSFSSIENLTPCGEDQVPVGLGPVTTTNIIGERSMLATCVKVVPIRGHDRSANLHWYVPVKTVRVTSIAVALRISPLFHCFSWLLTRSLFFLYSYLGAIYSRALFLSGDL